MKRKASLYETRLQQEIEILRYLQAETRKIWKARKKNLNIDIGVYNDKVQKLINDYQSLIGYGTAAVPQDSGEHICYDMAVKNSPRENKIVLDVGSRVGEWLYLNKNRQPQVEFHCFEPEPNSFSKLSRLYSLWGRPGNIILNNFAISDRNGKAWLAEHVREAGQATLANIDFSYLGVEFSEKYKVTTKTLSSYLRAKKIKAIDFLKLDVEGWEYNILSNNRPLFDIIDNIQFEFGIANIDTHHTFKDFWNLLSDTYNIYRIHPYGLIPIPHYRQELEVYHVANYFCSKRY